MFPASLVRDHTNGPSQDAGHRHHPPPPPPPSLHLCKTPPAAPPVSAEDDGGWRNALSRGGSGHRRRPNAAGLPAPDPAVLHERRIPPPAAARWDGARRAG